MDRLPGETGSAGIGTLRSISSSPLPPVFDQRSCPGAVAGGDPLLCGHGSCFSIGWGGEAGCCVCLQGAVMTPPPVKGCFISPLLFDSARRTHPRPCHSHHAFHTMRLPPWLLHWPNATVQPGNRRGPPAVSPAPPPPPRFHRNLVSGHAAPATASASVELPLRLLSLPISSGSFLSLLPGGGAGGLGGCNKGRRFTSNLPSTCII